MKAKPLEHQQAIKLRKQGKSYSEIVQLILVSQSSLSLWLSKISLSAKSKQRIKTKQQQGRIKGGRNKRRQRHYKKGS